MDIVHYRGLRIHVTLSAIRELTHHGWALIDVLRILEEGYAAPRKRKQGTIEMWLDRGPKTYNAVVVRDYDEVHREEIWTLIHFGVFTKTRR